jgi:hypothetical protein
VIPLREPIACHAFSAGFTIAGFLAKKSCGKFTCQLKFAQATLTNQQQGMRQALALHLQTTPDIRM